MEQKKLVSVGVPVYNEEPHLEELLQSIIDDEYKYKEIIISDNVSNDATWKIIKKFKEKYDYLFDIIIKQQSRNKGAIYNFNYVLEKARGEFFIWAGGHDRWGPNLIRECVDVLQKNQDAVLAMPLVKWIDNRSQLLDLKHCIIDTRQAYSPAGRVFALVKQYNKCTAIYGLHRRNILLNTTPWPKTLGNDDIALVRIAKQGNIVPVMSAFYFRRARLLESPHVRIQRQVRVLDLKGIAGKRPRTVFNILIFFEILQSKGPFLIKSKLIKLAFQKYLGIRMLKTILLEYSPALFEFSKKLKLCFTNDVKVKR